MGIGVVYPGFGPFQALSSLGLGRRMTHRVGIVLATSGQWVAKLRSAALPVVEKHVLGHDGLIDGPTRWPASMPFLRWRALRAGQSPAPESPADGDQAIWQDLIRGDDVRSVLERCRDEGPLFEQASTQTIEVWTEQELSSLQAIDWLAERSELSAVFARLDRGIAWHLERTQPDNATNRPWGISAFLGYADRSGDPDVAGAARLYAETLLHNALAVTGRPDVLSAHILLDAADRLSQPR